MDEFKNPNDEFIDDDELKDYLADFDDEEPKDIGEDQDEYDQIDNLDFQDAGIRKS